MKWANNSIMTCISVRLSIENASITQSTDYKHKGLSASDLDPFALPTPFCASYTSCYFNSSWRLQINRMELSDERLCRWNFIHSFTSSEWDGTAKLKLYSLMNFREHLSTTKTRHLSVSEDTDRNGWSRILLRWKQHIESSMLPFSISPYTHFEATIINI